MSKTIPHGGALDRAIARHGGARADWLDLSTGINQAPYPLPPIPPETWRALPLASEEAALIAAAREAYGAERAAIAPTAGAQAAIQLAPLLRPPGTARVLAPTYGEHAHCLRRFGWRVEEVGAIEALGGADLAVVVNPNNPDGRAFAPGALLALADEVGLLIVDESFVDPTPARSLAPHLGADRPNLLALRSFGKFYGLAGLRLGFVLGAPALVERIEALGGPWRVAGPALAIGAAALADDAWRAATAQRLGADAMTLDRVASSSGLEPIGGAALFRLYRAANAAVWAERLARRRILVRTFDYAPEWLRFGLPHGDDAWTRLGCALAAVAEEIRS